ncbi:MAG: hypothetical protein AAF701_07390, partial [Pseudomonadota bacterium]
TGGFNLDLVPINTADQSAGTLTLAFRVQPPTAPMTGVQSVTVARVLTTKNLQGLRQITVIGAQNQMSARVIR